MKKLSTLLIALAFISCTAFAENQYNSLHDSTDSLVLSDSSEYASEVFYSLDSADFDELAAILKNNALQHDSSANEDKRPNKVKKVPAYVIRYITKHSKIAQKLSEVRQVLKGHKHQMKRALMKTVDVTFSTLQSPITGITPAIEGARIGAYLGALRGQRVEGWIAETKPGKAFYMTSGAIIGAITVGGLTFVRHIAKDVGNAAYR